MTITREQVERAIKAAEHGYMDPWISYFGADWRGVVPRYVLAAYGDDSGGWETAAAALTRWRDELAAAEVRGPEPMFTGRPAPGHTFVPGSTEHGHEHQCAAPEPDGMRQCGYPEAAHEPIDDTAPDASGRFTSEHHLEPASPPAPEVVPIDTSGPITFVAGDGMRLAVNGIVIDGISYVAQPGDLVSAVWAPSQPAPAPEVVDVPQPVVKRCACPDVHDDVEAEWRPGEPYLTVTHTTIPLALLRAMLEAIDAQQGGAS